MRGEEGVFRYPEQFLENTRDLFTGERDINTNMLKEASQRMSEIVDHLPDTWPNGAALKRHVNAIRDLLPEVEEYY